MVQQERNNLNVGWIILKKEIEMVKALKRTPRSQGVSEIQGLTPRNNNPKAAKVPTPRGKPVAEVKFHVKRVK